MQEITDIYKSNDIVESTHYCFICKFLSDKKQFQSHLTSKQHRAMQRIKDLFHHVAKTKSSNH